MSTPQPASAPSDALGAFVARWHRSEGSERANKDSFLNELCDVLGVARPEPTTGDPDRDLYVFERALPVAQENGKVTNKFVDLYKDGAFVLEAKQGTNEAGRGGIGKRETHGWTAEMNKAAGQARSYAASVARPPPFLVVCDLGFCFDLFAAFDGSGDYRPFPFPQKNRLYLKDLAAHADTLRRLFVDPHSLDPSRHATKVTRDVAAHLADLARDLEASGQHPEHVAKFLMRCIFTMFAEDVALLPPALFKERIEKEWLRHPENFAREVRELWEAMDKGERFGFGGRLLRFNGGLFKASHALPLTAAQLAKLLECAKCDWSQVEPSIFGTLLERALSESERHKLGAHYTPRAYVERLVRPTLEEPLRAEWDAVRVLAQKALEGGKDAGLRKARKAVVEFHTKLCHTRVLDPACGTGNFLYVAFDLFKRLEGEVLALERQLTPEGATLGIEALQISPKQFLGIEIKPWAKEIADLVLWIGYLQWHFKLRGNARPEEPVLREYNNIDCRDAVLEWDRIEDALGDDGRPLTRWDGVTTKKHPVTGQDVPDETARIGVKKYVNPRPATWPEAEFVIGNPPFIGNFKMRDALGDGYVEALRRAYDAVPDSVDLVMYWWFQAAMLVRDGALVRAGLVTTTSLTHKYNRRVVEGFLEGKPELRLAFGAADHPWVGAKYGNTADGAEVRIAMTVTARGAGAGRLSVTAGEHAGPEGEAIFDIEQRVGVINAQLRLGLSATSAQPLRANAGLACPGVKLHGAGFVLSSSEYTELVAKYGARQNEVVRPYLNWQDIAARSRDSRVIDFFGHEVDAAARDYPALFQRVVEQVRPEREHNKRASYRENWWIFGEPRRSLRPALKGLPRFIATGEASRRRFFVFVDGAVLPDNTLIAIASDDPAHLVVLSSRVHVVFAAAAGGRLGIRQDLRYNKSTCFDPFPFPSLTDVQAGHLRQLGEELHTHRARQLELHPALTMSGMYGVLEKLRAPGSGDALTAKEKVIHEQGLVSVLKDVHDRLDAAVFEAYGWPADLSDEQIIERLVALNAERAAEEKRGLVRWLRPEFQNPAGARPAAQAELDEVEEEAPEPGAPAAGAALAWPKTLPERMAAVRDAVAMAGSVSAATLARALGAKKEPEVVEVLDGLAMLGHLWASGEGGERRWMAVRARAA